MTFKIRQMQFSDFNKVIHFADKWIGANYYNQQNLPEILELGQLNNMNACLVALDSSTNELVGIRIVHAPEKWLNKYHGRINPKQWSLPEDDIGYFKSLFIADKYQGQGLGKALSKASIHILKQMGAKGIICHSWLESPNNSSMRYLEKMGFEHVANHPKFWHDIDYLCSGCGKPKCVCTAAEMLLRL